MAVTFFSYWGKARPAGEKGESYHLLPFHCLDVAACGRALLHLPQFSLAPLADELGWPRERVEAVFVFFLALHDLGKFSRSFQGLAPNLSDTLVPADGRSYELRHDTLGWLCWAQILAPAITDAALPDAESGFWAVWVKSVVGHHGRPPQETASGGALPFDAHKFFLSDDSTAARAFFDQLQALLMPPDIPQPSRQQTSILKCHAWRLAGLSVLADWLGSNQTFFPYRTTGMALDEYWQSCALPQADKTLEAAGLRVQSPRQWRRPAELFDYLAEPTPLQRHAAEVDLLPGPQLFLLEDVTGAGKTEAALILAQRLMQAGLANGLYFALPSMATANQMYQRVGRVYRQLYAADARPSLVLAHGARQLVEGFRDSILHPGEQPVDRNYLPDEASATAQCSAWLADNRKKALLAEVGVGTLDQALLAVLPARHQSLRLLGLSGKVLLVDEVHAYDPYMMALLKTLLTAHARQGGSVVMLSATLPLRLRDQLLSAWRHGLGHADEQTLDDCRYPLAIQAGKGLRAHACTTRRQVRRRVSVRQIHSEDEALAVVLTQARAGRCVCWIRNTVNDARRAWKALREGLPEEDVELFHSRFAMGDRLNIEDRVLARFGKHSTAAQRRGKVLVGTQVLEQSLDFCVDVMVSDLAPIDLLIQRAGRLQRHARTASGDPAMDGIEQREPPVLYVLGPEPVDDPPVTWYSALFPEACFVYADAGRLWLGARALQRAGCIVTPGDPGESGSVRELVEAVYGNATEPIPDALQKATDDQQGKDYAMQSQGQFNRIRLDMGYCWDSSALWFEDSRVPTRLGDESLTIYLARETEGRLLPLSRDERLAWEQSAVRIDARRAKSLSPEWTLRYDTALQELRSRHRLLEEPAFVLPLVEVNGVLVGKVIDHRDRERVLRYDAVQGLVWE